MGPTVLGPGVDLGRVGGQQIHNVLLSDRRRKVQRRIAVNGLRIDFGLIDIDDPSWTRTPLVRYRRLPGVIGKLHLWCVEVGTIHGPARL